MARQTYVSNQLPHPAGPYSHSAGVGSTLYSAGQGGATANGAHHRLRGYVTLPPGMLIEADATAITQQTGEKEKK